MCKLLLVILIAAVSGCITYLIVGVIVWDIFAACFNFIYRDEIKRGAEQLIEELNAPYRERLKRAEEQDARDREANKRNNAYWLSHSKVHNK